MAFVGQLYASDRFPIDGHLALEFYVCDECQETRKWVHMEALPKTAAVNGQGVGVRCCSQPKLYISYLAGEDSTDQRTFNRRKFAEGGLPGKRLRRDKGSGLFAYQRHESPKDTRPN